MGCSSCGQINTERSERARKAGIVLDTEAEKRLMKAEKLALEKKPGRKTPFHQRRLAVIEGYNTRETLSDIAEDEKRENEWRLRRYHRDTQQAREENNR